MKDFSFWSCGTGKKRDVKNTATAQWINSYPCTCMIPCIVTTRINKLQEQQQIVSRSVGKMHLVDLKV